MATRDYAQCAPFDCDRPLLAAEVDRLKRQLADAPTADVTARLAELAEEIHELPAMLRDMAGGRCGEAVDIAVNARRMVRELRELLGVDTTIQGN